MKAISNVVWIDANVDNKENTLYRKELEEFEFLKLKCFKNTKEAIDYLKEIQFQETKVITSGRLYIEFLKSFMENLSEINVIPKIIIFTGRKGLFIEYNQQYKEYIEHPYYDYGGIKINFLEIKDFLKNSDIANKSNDEEDNDVQFNVNYFDNIIKFEKYKDIEKKLIKSIEDDKWMTFEYIDSVAKLALPLFYKTLLETEESDKYDKYTNLIFEKYSKESKLIKDLFSQIKSLKNIPIELLSKYYIRAYTIESNFYKNINQDLGFNKKGNHLIFIKILYEGIKLKSFPLASNNVLYRGSKIGVDEINKIKYYLENKIKNLPASIVFSRSFLSFSKEKKIAECFLGGQNNNKNLAKVLYIVEHDNNIDHSLATHGDIEKISFFPSEKEVLFFPFSCFEIKDIKKVMVNGENIFEIQLLYLGKYLKEIEKDNNIKEKGDLIPDSEFKKQIIEYGLIKHEKIKEYNTKTLFKEYKKYKDDINNRKKFNDINKSSNNYIICEFNIDDETVNKEIRIINFSLTSESEIRKKVEILVNNKKIDFSCFYKFKWKGKYNIKYDCINDLTDINSMFYGCSSLTNINLSNFKTHNVNNMGKMFYGCSSLTNINLSNFNTQNVIDMSYMFYGCSSLTNKIYQISILIM